MPLHADGGQSGRSARDRFAMRWLLCRDKRGNSITADSHALAEVSACDLDRAYRIHTFGRYCMKIGVVIGRRQGHKCDRRAIPCNSKSGSGNSPACAFAEIPPLESRVVETYMRAKPAHCVTTSDWVALRGTTGDRPEPPQSLAILSAKATGSSRQ